MASYLLGLDAGNTVIKAVLFDTEGRQLSAHAEPGVAYYPEPGQVERSLDELWEQAGIAIRNCIENAGIDAAEIIAIGCSGHGNGLYLLDKAQQPLLAIQSLDSRAMQLVGEYAADGRADAIYDICLQKPWPSQTPTLLAWIKRFAPDTFARIGTVFLCKDYMAWRLTGNIVSDYSDMSGCGLLRMPELDYDTDLLELYGLEDCREFLPPLFASTDVIGEVTDEAAAATGLKAGTPMVGGLFDVVASATGAGTVEPGAASVIAGTWSINQVIVDTPVSDPSIFMAAAVSKDRFVEIEASATSAANLEWMAREFFGETEEKSGEAAVFELCNDLVASVELDDGLPIYHPFLYGASTNGAARAGFYGIGGWHTRAHMMHALFEGVAFGHRRHIETLRSAGVTFDQATLSGGGSRSPVWPQMFADILEVDVAVADCQETGALGAAIAAGIGLSVFDGFADGAARMSKVERRYKPDAQKQAMYRRRYALYEELCTALAPVWDKLSATPEDVAQAAE